MTTDVVADVRQDDALRVGILAPPWVGVPPETYGGTELMLDSLARALVRLGHDVRLFTTADSRCPVTTAHLFEHSDPDRMGAAVLELRHVAAGYDDLVAAGVDIVHDHTLCGLFYNGRPADLPVVTTCHGPFDDDLVDIHRRTSHAVPVITISHDQARRAPSDITIAATIHHGIDPARYPFSSTPGDSFAFLGRMDSTKGVAEAARAARAAGVKLRIAAKMRNPTEFRYFHTEVEPLLDDRIVYIGEATVAEKLELLRDSIALINPIKWPEPFGLVMIEALACGTPVIGYPGGAAPEIVDHGVTGYLVESEEQLIHAIGRAGALDRVACRQRVVRDFTADRMAREHVEVYRSLIDQRRRVLDLRDLEGHAVW